VNDRIEHEASPPRRRGYVPLFRRVAALNALVVIVGVAVTVLVLAPHRISGLAIDEEIAVLAAAILLVVLLNLLLLRRVVGPLQALTALARRVDPARPGQRMPDARPTSEAGELALRFNEMLTRLETERREATGRVLAAQEAERLRIAQELHDQVGQELTAVLLLLARVQPRVPEALREPVGEVQDAVRTSLEDVRRIAIELRPEALDDLGLASALAVLCERFQRGGLHVSQRIDEPLPALSADAELVIYRVAQEALTNVARHSGSDQAELTLTAGAEGGVTLRVRDSGRGLDPAAEPGSGMRGMHERARLLGATLTIAGRGSEPGCEVRLAVPPKDAAS
jgi:two-component system sensor histidine kinase UhpB